MPVFLTPDVWDQWLRPEKISNKEKILPMLDRSPFDVATIVTAHPVARTVNNARTLDSEDWRRIEPASLTL